MKRILLATGAALTASLMLSTPKAEACGGLFCSTVPVNQTEEAIIFDVDESSNTVTAVINILYQGSADEFAWMLPLQVAPDEVRVGSRTAFQVAQNMTQPQFVITEIEDVGVCSFEQDNRAFDSGEGQAGGVPTAAPEADGGVDVVFRDEVGPYDTVVLSGTDPEAIRQWLIDNDFRVTDEMMDLVVPYIAQGDVILALKLLNNVTVGEISPIEVVMSADRAEREIEACVPIRLTAVAADPDMPITVYVFSDSGRAIPENFFHVEPNLLKIDWLRGGSNYRQLIADAVDEADAGHAFVTEYSGSPSIFDDQIFLEGQFDLERLRSHTDLADLLQDLINQGLLRRPGMRAILEKYFPAVAECPGCSAEEFRGQTIDANAAVDEIDEKIIAPDRRAQEIMTRRSHFTRMLTILDPEEMSVDPIFAYNSNLPDVTNVHTAKMIRDCGVGGTPGSAGVQIILEDGRTIAYASGGNPDNSILDAMPNAARIEQLAEGIVVRDNLPNIDAQLEEHNDMNGLGTCGCDSAAIPASSATSAALAAALGLLLLVRRRR